jgi:hypothetical protein
LPSVYFVDTAGVVIYILKVSVELDSRGIGEGINMNSNAKGMGLLVYIMVIGLCLVSGGIVAAAQDISFYPNCAPNIHGAVAAKQRITCAMKFCFCLKVDNGTAQCSTECGQDSNGRDCSCGTNVCVNQNTGDRCNSDPRCFNTRK